MAIRFQCGACDQPIEVDDEWAGKPVLCPYCRKAITAPTASTLAAEMRIGEASPVRDQNPPVWPSPAPQPTAPPRNYIATVALGLALLEVCLFVVMAQILSANRLELEEFSKLVADADGLAGMLEAQNKYYQSRGGVPTWLVTFGMTQVAIIANWFPLVACGVIGVLRPVRRGRAIVALCVAGLVPFLFCCAPMVARLVA